jgi:carbamoylphosphate synthase large subunit
MATFLELWPNKRAARTTMKTLGLPIPAFWFGNDLDIGLSWAHSVGWPVVAKAAHEVESRVWATRLCRDSASLAGAFRQILLPTEEIRNEGLTPQIVLEKFIDGPEFCISVIANTGCRPHIAAVSEKLLGPGPSFFEVGHAIPPSLRQESLATIKSVALQAVEALGVSGAICNVEIRIDKNKPLIVGISCGPGESYFSELVRVTSGWDLLQVARQLASDLPLHPPSGPIAKCGVYHCITTEAEAVIGYHVPEQRDAARVPLLVEMDVAPGTKVFPINHIQGRILGRMLSFGERPSDAWNGIRNLKQYLNLTFTSLSSNLHDNEQKSCDCWGAGCC